MPSLSEIIKSKIGTGVLTKTYVANEMNVTEKTIENYMNGKREPKGRKLIRLAEILGFELNELSEHSVRKSEPVASHQAFEDLIESHKKQSEAFRLFGEAARDLTKSHYELIEIAKRQTAFIIPDINEPN